VNVREIIGLENCTAGRLTESAHPETPGSHAAYTLTLRCTGRTLYQVSAIGENQEGIVADWPHRFVTAAPGDSLEIRLDRAEPARCR
jgi:hypothetical protein